MALTKRYPVVYKLSCFQPHEVPEKWRSNSTPRSRSVEDSARSECCSSLGRRSSTAATGANNSCLGRKAEAVVSSSSASLSSSSPMSSCALAATLLPTGSKPASKGRNKRDGKEQLDMTLTRLLNRLPDKEDPIDATYLLDLDKRRRGGGGRKKRWTASSASSLLLE